MITCEKVAKAFVNEQIQKGITAEQLACLKANRCVAAQNEKPTIWTYMGWPVYLDQAGDQAIKLKKGQIGVVLRWMDGRREYRIFNALKLHDDIVNPKPKQLPLWAEMENADMISIPRFCELEKLARKAAQKGDLATVATLNKDEELRSANIQFMVVEQVCYIATLDKEGDRSTVETVVKETPHA